MRPSPKTPSFLPVVLHQAARGLLNLFFPPRCHACRAQLADQEAVALCRHCQDRVVYLSSPLCNCCGQPLPSEAGTEDRFCGLCLSSRPAFDSARSLARYEPPVSTLLQRLKFHGDVSAARALAALGRPAVPPFDLLLPVPLHPVRLRARGMNQSQVLARRFFPDAQERIVVDLLVRIKNTEPQMGLDGRQRRRNLRGAFSVTSAAALRGQRVCVIDDVFTTGTTLLECAKTLRSAGAARVYAWTVARV